MPGTDDPAGVSASPEKPPTLLDSWREFFKATHIVLKTLRLAWVSVAATLLGGLLFLIPDQSRDVIRALMDAERWEWEQVRHALFFLGALVLWALSAQIWARIMTMHPRAPCKYPRRYNNHTETMATIADCADVMPRLLGFSVFITMAMAIGCIVLETAFFVYALVALPFLPLLLTLFIVLKRPQREKTLLLWTLAGVAAIAFLVLLAYALYPYVLQYLKENYEATWNVGTLVAMMVTPLLLLLIPPLLFLVQVLLRLQKEPTPAKIRAPTLTVAFFLPMFLLLAAGAEFSYVLKAGKVCDSVFTERRSEAEECKDELIYSSGLEEKPLLEFYMAKDKVNGPEVIEESVWSIWSATMPAIKLLGARLSMNWSGLLACGILFVFGIAWLLVVRNSLVDTWMGWNKDEWLRAAESRNGKDKACEPGSDAPIAAPGNRIASRNRYKILGALYGSVAVVAYLTFLLFPVTVGQALGPAAVIALFLPFVIAPLALLSRLSLTWRFPVLASVLTVLAILGIKFDQHYVRKIDDQSNGEQVLWIEAFGRWYDAARKHYCKPKGDCKKGTKLPIVIVSTAGGGLRAAYWTASVLGELHDMSEGKFSESLFAISGVSGGALGASVYRALLTEEEQGRTLPECRTSADPDSADRLKPSLARCAQRILSRDSLAPALGSMLFTDTVNRVLPLWPILSSLAPDWGIPKWFRDRDRAAALEESWEESWRHALGRCEHEDNLFAGSFLDLWSAHKPYPALFLNGTSVLSGRRIITSNLTWNKLAESDRKRDTFPDAVNFLQESGMTIRVSTAANNSARFPVIGPAGTFKMGDHEQQEQVVDGGYFENFGATTAFDLVRGIIRNFPSWQKEFVAKPGKPAPGLHLIFVQISSDPTLPEPDEDSVAYGQIGGDFLAPILALASTRTSRGTYQSGVAQLELHPDYNKENIQFQYVPIRMNTRCGWGTPLGWTISARMMTKLSLQDRGDCAEDVAPYFDNIIKAVTGRPKVFTERVLEPQENAPETRTAIAER